MNKLDQEILSWIAEHTGDTALAKQIAKAEISRRDYMRTGFFVYFKIPDGLAAADAALKPVCPSIDSSDLMDGAGCTLFLRNGFLHYLEIYARGGFFPESLGQWQLRKAE